MPRLVLNLLHTWITSALLNTLFSIIYGQQIFKHSLCVGRTLKTHVYRFWKHVFVNQVCYCLPCISYLPLEAYVLILNGLDPVFTVCDSRLMLPLNPNDLSMMACRFLSLKSSGILLVSCCWIWGNIKLQQCFLKHFAVVDWKITAHASPLHWCNSRISMSLLAN